MKKILKWLDQYDEAMWSIFKIVAGIAFILLGVAIHNRYEKNVVKEAIKEVSANK